MQTGRRQSVPCKLSDTGHGKLWKTVPVQPHDSRRRGHQTVRRSRHRRLLRASAAAADSQSFVFRRAHAAWLRPLCSASAFARDRGFGGDRRGVRATYSVFSGAQNSSYSGDGRSSALSSSREEKLVGSPSIFPTLPPEAAGLPHAALRVCV